MTVKCILMKWTLYIYIYNLRVLYEASNQSARSADLACFRAMTGQYLTATSSGDDRDGLVLASSESSFLFISREANGEIARWYVVATWYASNSSRHSRFCA